MDLNPQEQELYQLVKKQLGNTVSHEEAEKIVSEVGVRQNLPTEMTARLLERFRSEFKPLNPQNFTPRLLVDWGEMPRVGYQVRPEFNLICPNYGSRPEVSVSVDRDLDHDERDPRRSPQSDEPGLWSFHVPFCMATSREDCRPGHYLVQVNVAFRDVPPELPRFYRCSIRLSVSGTSAGDGGVLEIEGDGQSMVNLQGYNLKQFSKVILRGGNDSVINLQNTLGSLDAAAPSRPDKPLTTFEYQFKVDQEKQSKIPRLVNSARQRAYLDTAGFFFEDGRRTIVMARSKIKFGRSRENDVVLRFLPAGDENDSHTMGISRGHFTSEFKIEGIEICDSSSSGIEVNSQVVRGSHLFVANGPVEVNEIKLGVTGTVSMGFELGMVLFAPDRRETLLDREHHHELVCETVGAALSPLARQSLATGLDAVRYDRMTTLSGEETYVHLLREATIGGLPTQASILLKKCGNQRQARLLHVDRSFWLQPLPGCLPVMVDGVPILPHSLVALSPGMEIRFGNEAVRFNRKAQLHLDPQPPG